MAGQKREKRLLFCTFDLYPTFSKKPKHVPLALTDSYCDRLSVRTFRQFSFIFVSLSSVQTAHRQLTASLAKAPLSHKSVCAGLSCEPNKKRVSDLFSPLASVISNEELN